MCRFSMRERTYVKAARDLGRMIDSYIAGFRIDPLKRYLWDEDVSKKAREVREFKTRFRNSFGRVNHWTVLIALVDAAREIVDERQNEFAADLEATEKEKKRIQDSGAASWSVSK